MNIIPNPTTQTNSAFCNCVVTSEFFKLTVDN
jgi:hypothetical protein